MKFKYKIFFIFTLITYFSISQNRISSNKSIQDSICKYGEKFTLIDRYPISFPSLKVTKEYKIAEIHKALPDSLNDENKLGWWTYDYFFISKLTDFDTIKNETFTPKEDNFLYKLKDTYFFDINGDGLTDFIHYPLYYKAIMRDGFDEYDIFIKEKTYETYKWINFRGYITNINFNSDGSLMNLTTFQNFCCDDNQCTFRYYEFDKQENDLILKNTKQILTCQLKRKKI